MHESCRVTAAVPVGEEIGSTVVDNVIGSDFDAGQPIREIGADIWITNPTGTASFVVAVAPLVVAERDKHVLAAIVRLCLIIEHAREVDHFILSVVADLEGILVAVDSVLVQPTAVVFRSLVAAQKDFIIIIQEAIKVKALAWHIHFFVCLDV